jgi:membrane-anchored protein YejM (alkaline phosphatase superfamily)
VNSSNTTQWQQFTKVVESLNAKADLNTAYKVLFMGRHGEGFHNAAESYYGTPSWNVRQLSRREHSTIILTIPTVLLV